MRSPYRLQQILFLSCIAVSPTFSQTFPTDDAIIKSIWSEAMDSTKLPILAHELFDVIGPRLVGSPAMARANSWALEKYRSWGIDVRNEQFGTWRGWERGITHIDLLKPRVRSLEGTMLAWSPGTPGEGITAQVISLPDVHDSLAFQHWLLTVKGKFVLVSQPQPTGRPDKNWEEFGTKESFDSLKALRDRMRENWDGRIGSSGAKADSLPLMLEHAGAAGIMSSLWSQGWGTYRIFGTITKKIPVLALSLEDYNLLMRLADHGDKPVVRVIAESSVLDRNPVVNTIATMRGVGKPDEYVILSAHFDSWDGSSGATDNGTGTLTMMEAMRILRKYYPSPKRTIMVGHWGSEEQGLNGSRAFVSDHPEIVQRLQALFNQDNGTGRVTTMSGAGLLNAGDHIARWLSRIPTEVTQQIKLEFPGTPPGGGSDNASFIAAGAPSFGLRSLDWDYFSSTWHTNRDTYDKIVFDDLKNNVVLAACLAYLASEDPLSVLRDKRVLPTDKLTGKPHDWPAIHEPERAGGMK